MPAQTHVAAGGACGVVGGVGDGHHVVACVLEQVGGEDAADVGEVGEGELGGRGESGAAGREGHG